MTIATCTLLLSFRLVSKFACGRSLCARSQRINFGRASQTPPPTDFGRASQTPPPPCARSAPVGAPLALQPFLARDLRSVPFHAGRSEEARTAAFPVGPHAYFLAFKMNRGQFRDDRAALARPTHPVLHIGPPRRMMLLGIVMD